MSKHNLVMSPADYTPQLLLLLVCSVMSVLIQLQTDPRGEVLSSERLGYGRLEGIEKETLGEPAPLPSLESAGTCGSGPAFLIL